MQIACQKRASRPGIALFAKYLSIKSFFGYLRNLERPKVCSKHESWGLNPPYWGIGGSDPQEKIFFNTSEPGPPSATQVSSMMRTLSRISGGSADRS